MEDVSNHASSDGNKVIQHIKEVNERDSDQVENVPGPFAGEQTWPTEEEMKNAKKERKKSKNNEDENMLVEAENTVTSHYPVSKKDGSLEDMFDRLEIKVQGQENEERKSENSLDE